MTAIDRVATTYDKRELRGVLGRFATGVTVLTAGRDTPRGMTANAFTSVSLDPPLILVCVVRTAAIHDVILEEGAFAVSVLAGHQEGLATYFADHSRPRGRREFETVDTVPGKHTGTPVLSGAQAWLECRLAAVHEGGDHSIFVGSVLDVGREEADDPLLYFGGGFHRLTA
ncbi:flavin reductase family protein [Streptomyces sp. R302]|uniref:flavin reductase family protein n=1 Tax=unclassified Streptomyces TaxID=2593676 RepID=UPI00145CF79E|nr:MULTISPECIES: flavin reductase family protein [unclassified Streptomyces]NML50986.1 flavin reductase family protein [Streptomyces sp. R301]NML81080.1 flavin reductase family protein [Streptomyces sp. R302]